MGATAPATVRASLRAAGCSGIAQPESSDRVSTMLAIIVVGMMQTRMKHS